MAIAYRSGSTVSATTRTNTTFTAPAGIQDNNVLIVSLIEYASGAYPSPAITPPTGFAEITNSPISHNAYGVYTRHHVYWKRASSESGNYTFTHSSRGTEGWIGCYSGVTTDTSPFDATPTANNGVNSPSVGSSITTSTDGAMVILLEHDYYDVTGGNTPPTGMTERFDSAAGGLGFMYAADVIQATAGASGNKSFANNNDNDTSVWAAFLVALKPAGATAYTLTADAGAYAVAGQAANLEQGREAAAGSGSYTASGTAASLERGYKVTAGGGAYTLSGTAAAVGVTARVVSGASGGYTVNGVDADLLAGLSLTAGNGSYALNGSDVTLTVGAAGAYTLGAGSGSYEIVGPEAALSIVVAEPDEQPTGGVVSRKKQYSFKPGDLDYLNYYSAERKERPAQIRKLQRRVRKKKETLSRIAEPGLLSGVQPAPRVSFSAIKQDTETYERAVDALVEIDIQLAALLAERRAAEDDLAILLLAAA